MLNANQFSASQGRSIQNLAERADLDPFISRLRQGNNPYAMPTAYRGLHGFVQSISGLPKKHRNAGVLAKDTRPLVNRKKRKQS